MFSVQWNFFRGGGVIVWTNFVRQSASFTIAVHSSTVLAASQQWTGVECRYSHQEMSLSLARTPFLLEPVPITR